MVTIGSYIFGFSIIFDGASPAGFTVVRRSGRARFAVTVADPRIDRRLRLCVVAMLADSFTSNVSHDAALLAAPFTPRSDSH